MLPVKELPRHGFTVGDIAVKLDPGSSYDFKSTLLDSHSEPFKDLRIVLLKPPVVSSRGGTELEASIFEQVVDELELSGPGSGNLTLSLGVRPHPSCINVAVADSVDSEGVWSIDVLGYESITFLCGLFSPFIRKRHEVLVGAVVDEVKVSMGSGTLLLVQLSGGISDHGDVEEVAVNNRVEKANLTLGKLEVLVHIYLAVTPLVVSYEVTEHLLTGHFK